MPEQRKPTAFIILEDNNIHRIASYKEALELCRLDHVKDPTRKFIVAQILASIEPVVQTKVNRHFR